MPLLLTFFIKAQQKLLNKINYFVISVSCTKKGVLLNFEHR